MEVMEATHCLGSEGHGRAGNRVSLGTTPRRAAVTGACVSAGLPQASKAFPLGLPRFSAGLWVPMGGLRCFPGDS